MQLYHTYYQWKEAALDELAQFKSHAMGEILAEMKTQSNQALKVKSELEVKSCDHIVKIDDLTTLKMELKVEQKTKATRIRTPRKKSPTPTPRKVSNTEN
jgi:hypothetical protein